MKTARVDRTLAILLVACLIGFSILSQTIDAGSKDQVDGSVASTEPEGRRALCLMLGELGFAPQAWRQMPGVLPRGDHLLWLARAPEPWTKSKSDGARNERAGDESEADESAEQPAAAEDAESEPARDTTPAALDLHALVHYRRFVEEGGTLVIEQNEATERFLAEVLGLEAARRLSLVEAAPAGLRRVRTAAGEELEADWSAGSIFADLDPGESAREIWFGTRAETEGAGGTEGPEGMRGLGADEAERPLAVAFPVANGRVVLLGDDRFLDNAQVGARDHALLAVRLLEELATSGKLFFDEYALGVWETPSAFELALSPALALVTLHLVLLLALFVWRLAWVRGFPRDPEELKRVSPLARARALASLLVRARRYDLLAHDLRQAVTARLRARARLRASVARPADGASADAERVRQAAEHDLTRIAVRIGRGADLERWRAVLVSRSVSDEAGFDRLARDLAQIEREVGVEAGGPVDARRGRARLRAT